MSETIGWDILMAIGLFFMNPLFWGAMIAAVLLGYFRVKRERKSFRIRLLPGFTELKRLISESWVVAIVLSVAILGVGLVVDVSWLILYCFASLLVLLSFNYKFASPIYFVAAAFFVLLLFGDVFEGLSLLGYTLGSINGKGQIVTTVTLIGGLLLIAEGWLISRYGKKDPSPFLINTQRGLQAAVYKSKRLWLLPVLFLIPGDMITAFLPYWPQLTLGENAFSIVPIPLLIGFTQISRANYASVLIPKVGQTILMMGCIVVLAGIGAIWLPVIGWIGLVLGVLGRIAISVVVSVRERSGVFAVAPRSTGVVIAGVLPDSPGERMGLEPGECIRSVNGQQVSNEKELYDAIQINAAHCRLQIIDRNGEVRLMQQVIYRHDHHRLGLLVVR